MITKEKITINGKKLGTQTSGQGNDMIFFIHGSSMDSSTWLPQLNDKGLNKKYKLIAIDLPGHGDSDWMGDISGYSLSALTKMLLGVIEYYQPSKYILAGLSYGTNIIGEIISPRSGCIGILLAGPCLINNHFTPADILTPGPFGHVIVAAEPSENDLLGYVNYGTSNAGVAERYFTTYRKTDPLFRQELGNATMNGGWTDELLNMSKWNVPVCVVFGKEEKFIKNDYLDNYELLWRGKTFKLEGAGHVVNEENVTGFNRILMEYADERFK